MGSTINFKSWDAGNSIWSILRTCIAKKPSVFRMLWCSLNWIIGGGGTFLHIQLISFKIDFKIEHGYMNMCETSFKTSCIVLRPFSTSTGSQRNVAHSIVFILFIFLPECSRNNEIVNQFHVVAVSQTKTPFTRYRIHAVTTLISGSLRSYLLSAFFL